jgi:hypothetical protein
MDWNKVADDATIQRTVDALKANGIEGMVVENGEAAKKKVLELVPKGAEVMAMTSVTLQTIGVTQAIDESGGYNSVRNQLNKLDRATQNLEMQKLGAAPEYALGSVHAVTEDGKVMIASNTGSQLPAYAYGSAHVIWVVGAQKIVKDLDAGFKRIYDHILPLESVRLNKQYNINTGSFVSKVLIVNREFTKGRVTMIIVKEPLGF